jgi:putative addiction module component (TIGR02574 family)
VNQIAGSGCFDIVTAMQSQLTEQAKKLSIPDRILLVEEIWDSIAEKNEAFELTEAQQSELDRRLESARANPASVSTVPSAVVYCALSAGSFSLAFAGLYADSADTSSIILRKLPSKVLSQDSVGIGFLLR